MNEFEPMNGPDRITQILQSASGYQQASPPPLPGMMPEPIQQPIPLSIAVQQGVAAGHPQAVALDNRIKMMTNSPEEYEAALQYLHDMPGEIDPANSYQVNTALAGWRKQIPSPLQLGIQDLGNIASGKGTNYLGLKQEAEKNAADIAASEALATYRASGKAGSKAPAAIQIANAIRDAELRGDTEMARYLRENNKVIKYDPGLIMGQNGIVEEMPGYGTASGGIKYQEQLMGTTGHEQAVLGYAGPIEAAKQEAQSQAAPLKEFGSKVGADIGAALVVKKAAAEEANKTIVSNNEARRLLNKAITGAGAEYMLNFGRALSQVGLNFADSPVENTQAFLATRAQEVGRVIKAFGSGTGLSDADRDYAEKAAAGKIEMNAGAMKKIMDISDRAAKYAISNYSKELSKVPKRNLPYDIGIEPISEPNPMEGKTIINKATGERRINIGGQWVPIK